MGVRILASVPLYPPGSRVGAWLATHACLAHLVSLGHHVDVVPYLPVAGHAYDLDGVHVHPLADLDSFDRPDIVLSHLGDDQIAARWAADRSITSVRMAHGTHPDNAANLAETPCALAVFNSTALHASMPCDVPAIVVHPPFDPDDVTTTPGDLVTLVNLSESKGGSLFWQLAHSMIDVQFLGVRGGYGHQVSDKAKNVTAIDPTGNMARDVYARTRILLMPSERETWGMVGLEAMCSGIPVIAHPTDGLRESLGDAAVFVDRDDIDTWRFEIRRLLRPAEWAQASADARAHAATYSPAGDLHRFAEAITDVALVPA